MNKCDNDRCPLKENCLRFYDKKENVHVWLFTESPGAYRIVNGKNVWVCDKQIKKENE